MPKGIKKQKQTWGKVVDVKLQKLFQLRNSRGGVDSRDLTQKK